MDGESKHMDTIILCKLEPRSSLPILLPGSSKVNLETHKHYKEKSTNSLYFRNLSSMRADSTSPWWKRKLIPMLIQLQTTNEGSLKIHTNNWARIEYNCNFTIIKENTQRSAMFLHDLLKGGQKFYRILLYTG